MAAPPVDVQPSALWLKLSQRPRPFTIVDFPRYDAQGEPEGKIAIWVLTQQEQVAAAATAEATARRLMRAKGNEIPKSDEQAQGYRDIYDNEAAVEVLMRACRDVDDVKRPAFRTTEDVRALTVDEVGVLFSLYLEVQATSGPLVLGMSDEQFEMWVTRLAEAGSTFPLVRLPSQERNDLIMRLVASHMKSLTGNGSSGSPPDDGETESSPSPTPES